MKLDSLRDLEMFLAIVDAGGFTAAARRLGLTVNVVSRRLRELERALGHRLIERTTRKSSPTDAGKALHARLGPLLEAALAAEGALSEAREKVRGRVRVALPAPVVSAGLLRSLDGLLRTHRELRVELKIGSPLLPGEGDIDVSVVTTRPPPTHRLVGRKVGTHAWGLAAAPQYANTHPLPASPRELVTHECLLFSGGKPQTTWTLVGPTGRAVKAAVRGRFESDDSRVLADATYAGLGIGVRPLSELDDAVGRGALVRVLPEWRFGVVDAWVLTTAARRPTRRVALVFDALVEAVARLG